MLTGGVIVADRGLVSRRMVFASSNWFVDIQSVAGSWFDREASDKPVLAGVDVLHGAGDLSNFFTSTPESVLGFKVVGTTVFILCMWKFTTLPFASSAGVGACTRGMLIRKLLSVTPSAIGPLNFLSACARRRPQPRKTKANRQPLLRTACQLRTHTQVSVL